MELQYFGANCIKITTKKATVIIDDNLDKLGAKSVIKGGEVLLFTQRADQAYENAKIVIGGPGEYEVSDVSIKGVAARAHTDESGLKATMYKIIAEDIRVAVVGHIFPDLNEEQLEELGTVDILLVPVGGNGFTLDPTGAAQVIKKIEPKIVIPTYYADAKLDYPVPAQDLESALKGIALEPKETVDKLKLKGTDSFAEGTQLVILKKT